MKPVFSCLLLVLAMVGYGATNPTSVPTPLTAKEIAQGYREHVILARPRASRLATIDTEEAGERVHVREKFSRFGELRVIDLDDTDNAAAAIARLRATGRYDFVEPDYLRYLQATPNDPRYLDGSLWQFKNNGQSNGVVGADISAVQAWDIVHDAPSVIVAVVDTGVNLTHQDIAGNLWSNPNPTRGDLHGANFVGGRGSFVSGNPADDDGHGTHVAGIIGAVGNNGVAGAGVAWKVQIMAVKVFPPNASGSVSEIAAGVNYAISHGATIINASYGANGSTGYTQAELTVINSARAAGIIFVAAAGNESANLDTSRAYPASYASDNIVTVGSSNRRDEVSTFSNYGAAVDLFAPGEEITSLNYSSSTGTVAMSGTSMAAPQIAGAFALLKAQYPNDTYRQLINRMLRGTEHGIGDKFAGKAQTGGRLNLYKALTTTTNRPFNDDFADRPHFNADNLSIRSNNTGASAESGEPAITGAPATSTLWWEWTSTTGGTVTVNTQGSAYDTVLAVYTGTSLNGLTLVAANDNDGSANTSRVSFTANPGTTYQIAVDGKNGANGLTLLNVGTIPSNDAFATPVVLTGNSTHVTATNANCSREPNEPKILGFPGGTSLWYQWTAPRSGTYQASVYTNDFDPILAVYTGTALNSLTVVSASDNTGADSSQSGSLCTINATAGTTYMISVDSKSAVGEFTLSLTDSAWQATTGGSVTGAPAVASDGTVYVGSTDRSVYAFASDGSLKWSYATGGLVDTCSPAIADDGTVYVGSNDGKLYAFDPASGAVKWSHDFSANGSVVGAGCSPAVAADGTIYMRVTDGYLHALAPDGTEKWKKPVNATTTTFYGNPVIGPDGTIYQGSDENDGKLYAFTPDGTAKWSVSTSSGVYGAPAIDAAGNIYVAALDGNVYKFSPTGAQLWNQKGSGNISSSVALSADGSTLYYADYKSVLYARDTSTGNVRWTYTLGAEVRASSPAVDANGVIYIGCYDFRLYAINPNGSLARTYDMGNWLRSGPALVANGQGGRLYVGSNDQKLYAFDLAVGPASGPWPQYRFNARRLGRAVTESLAIVTQPQSGTAILGASFTLSVTATGQAPLAFQWSKDGTAIPGATAASYSVSSVTAATAGTYTVTITGPQGSITSNAAVVTAAAANPGRLMNLSVRTTAGTAAQTLIVGFVVSGSDQKSVLIRGIGPTLAKYGVVDALATPQLQVINAGNGSIMASNTGWDGTSTLSNTFTSVGAFPLDPGSKDDALILKLPISGYTRYTANVLGANGTTGTALAEVYDLDGATAASRLFNISARAQVGTGGNVLIAGFVISGNVPKQLLIRGVGPGLTKYGVTGVLAAPKLEIFSNGAVVKSNAGWGSDPALSAAFSSVGAFALDANSKDAALLIILAPGAYTAQVSGVSSTTGVALVEVYELP